MARQFKPSAAFTTPAELLIPTYSKSKGVPVKSFPAAGSGVRINVCWKTYGGTETETNGLYTVLNTAIVETWYRPDIKSDCRIRLFATGQVFEIIGQPENIEMRNQFLKFKVSAIESGA